LKTNLACFSDNSILILVLPFLFIIYSAHKDTNFFAKERFFEPNIIYL